LKNAVDTGVSLVAKVRTHSLCSTLRTVERINMYQPQHFKEERLDVLHRLIHDHPLGALVTMSAEGLNANHIPFRVDAARGTHGTLCAHVARGNNVWEDFSRDRESLVIFQGPDAYVTPSWYAAKKEHGKVVPTWDYAVVHVYGPLVIRDDKAWLHEFLNQLTDHHERQRPAPWKVGDAPDDYIDKLMGAIVGIEVPITKIIGKWKVSQNRPAADREGVAAGLAGSASETERAMGSLVRGGA
jgi:transcriptional regulator